MKRKKNNNLTMHCETFESVRALLETCDDRAENYFAKSRNNDNDGWAGESYEQARELLTYGDADLVKSLRPKAPKYAESVRPRTRPAVSGFAPIVPRSIIGIPRDMKRKESIRVNSKVITLVIDIGYACGNSPEQIARRGRELCEMIQGAELAGYRIGLDVFFAIQSEGKSEQGYSVRLNIKKPSAPLDIKHVCFPLVHSSMLRKIFFDWYERYPKAEYISRYGTCLYAESKDWQSKVLSQVLKQNEKYVDLMKADFSAIL